MSEGYPLQNPYLNTLRKEHVPVSIYLANGIKLQGQIESFDQSVILLKNTVSQMVYEHAISTVVPSRPVCLPSGDQLAESGNARWESALFFERPGGGEQAVLVHLEGQNPETRRDPQELQELVRSAGAETVAFVNASHHQLSVKYLVGSGRVEELHDLVKAENVELVTSNHTLVPSQERDLEQAFECRVPDRTGLVLDIFIQHARIYEGKLQVELTQLEHMSTRLARSWTYFERQKGGISLRGPGEAQLEIDRRPLRVRTRQIKQRPEEVCSQREWIRRGRKRVDTPAVSLVDYTNTGKSTLFNALTAFEVYAASQLFVTLDPTLCRLQLDDLGLVVLADTVGFIRHLSHKLVEIFRAALEESNNADLLLYVTDACELERDAQVEQVLTVLSEIGANELSILEVHSKADLLPSVRPHIQRDDSGKPVCVWLLAQTGEGLGLSHQAIAELLGEDLFVETLRLPQRLGRLRAQLFELGAVQPEAHDEEGCTLLQVRLPQVELDRLVSRAGWQSVEFVAQHILQ